MQVLVTLTHKVDNLAWLPKSSRAANSMQVLLRALCVLELDHMADIHSIEAAASEIVANKHGYFTFI